MSMFSIHLKSRNGGIDIGQNQTVKVNCNIGANNLNQYKQEIARLNAIKNSGFSSSNNMLIKVLSLSIIIISMFFLGNNPLTGKQVSFSSIETSFIMLFILGFFTSFHCIGMCCGILLTQTINKKDDSICKKRIGKTVPQDHQRDTSRVFNTGNGQDFELAL